MAELKRIDFETGVFVANSTRYTIEGALTIERYAEMQLLEREMGYGNSFQAFYGKHEKLMQLLNKMKFADAVILLNDIMRGVAKLQEREPTVLKICCLFINYEGENRAEINQDVMNKKIADWKAEGIDMRDFFLVASSSVTGFLEIYKTVTRSISEQAASAVGL